MFLFQKLHILYISNNSSIVQNENVFIIPIVNSLNKIHCKILEFYCSLSVNSENLENSGFFRNEMWLHPSLLQFETMADVNLSTHVGKKSELKRVFV